MNVVDIKSDLHTLIDKINDLSVLNAVKVLLNKQVFEPDLWDDLPESVKESIEKGIEQAEKGDTKPHDEVMKKYSKWLSK